MFKERVIFNRTKIEESAFFNSATFEGEAVFRGVLIGGQADFARAVFKANASFDSARVEGAVGFGQATFEGKATFDSARIEKFVYLVGATFEKDVNCEDASFRSVFLCDDGDEEVPFKANVDLRGCTYDRIEPVGCWKELMDRLEPYDRQPYTQLEAVFRRSGRDRLADDVYYQRRRRETSQRTAGSPRWLLDHFLRLLTGYGTRLRRLVPAVVLIVVLGSFVFTAEGAVEPKANGGPSPVAGAQLESRRPWPDGLMVSVDAFLPVEIAAVTPWKPSHDHRWGPLRFTEWATILSVAGWILVPVAVAGLTGILKR